MNRLYLFAIFLPILVISAEGPSVCYGDLGCFSTNGNFHHFPLPQSPAYIRTVFRCFTRQKDAIIQAGNASSVDNIGFSRNRSTKIIIHGYLDDGATPWVVDMKNALLAEGDSNVIVVDWGHGAKTIYTIAAANTFVVGVQIAQMVKYLHDRHFLDLDTVHLIGHSLGAHVAGFAGSKVSGIARISGLDPADPMFTKEDDEVRLDKSDANFVDVIHTDGSKFVGIAGYGMMEPSGHIDFYPNGGQNQPGCTENQLHVAVAIEEIAHGDINGAATMVSCSHAQAVQYFMQSINTTSCKLLGHPCSNYTDFEAGRCMGCPHGGCPEMGLRAGPNKAHGSFYLNTLDRPPYCGKEYFVEVQLSHWMFDAYGDLFIQLVGSLTQSTELRFNRKVERYHHDLVEHHIVISDVDVGEVREVKVKFVHIEGLGGLLTLKQLNFHRVSVKTEDNSHPIKFCAHEHVVHDDHVLAIMSNQRGC